MAMADSCNKSHSLHKETDNSCNVEKPSTTSVEDLQNLLNELEKLNDKRIGIMKGFHVYVCHLTDPPSCGDERKDVDLCALIEETKNWNAKIYFNNQKHATDDGRYKNNPRRCINNSICRHAHLGGDLISNRGGGNLDDIAARVKTGSPTPVLRLQCQCGKVSRSLTAGHDFYYNTDCRQDSYNNNRRNNRSGRLGAKGKRRSDTHLPVDADKICPFKLVVWQDKHGFYVLPKKCNVFHEYHPRRDHLGSSLRYLRGEEMELIEDCGTASSFSGTGRNLHYVRAKRAKNTPTLLTSRQIRYVQSGQFEEEEEDGKSNKEKNSDVDNLYVNLSNQKCSYVSLLQRSPDSRSPRISDNQLFSETCKGGRLTSTTNVLAGGSDDPLMAEANIFATKHRVQRKIRPDQDLMIGIAFASPFQLKRHMLFPQVIHIDCTADTNKEQRPLLTITAKDSNGHFFTVLTCYLPNEKAWSFKWFFANALPSLVWPSALKQTKHVITDGDFVCIQQLEDAMAKHMPWCTRGRCSWHIIDRGWVANVGLPLGGYSSRKKRPIQLRGTKRKTPAPLTIANKLGRVFYRWMFTWAQADYCVNKDEFDLSVGMFFFLLRRTETKAILGEDAHDLINSFYLESVYPHLDHMCFYNRKNLYHMDQHTNCGHEGTNNGLKHCASPVHPQSRIDRSVEILRFNEEVKSGELMNEMCSKMNSTKCWSKTATSGQVTDLVESILCQEWIDGTTKYKTCRTSRFRWLCCCNGYDSEDAADAWKDWAEAWKHGQANKENDTESPEDKALSYLKQFGLVPRFKRVHEITLNQETSCLNCSCGFWNRYRLPCRHLAAVIKSCDALKKLYPNGFPLSSIGVRWLKAHYYYGVSNLSEHRNIILALRRLAENDTKGLHCPSDLQEERSYLIDSDMEATFLAPARDRVLNYTKEQVEAAFPSSDDEDFGLGGFSQISAVDDFADHPMYEIADPDNTIFERLKKQFYDCVEAIQNSGEVHLEEELAKKLDELTLRARKSDEAPSGKVVSLLPANSKKRKATGISLMM